MLAELKQYFKQFRFLTPADLAALMKVAKVMRVKKGEVLVNIGEMDHRLCAVLTGFFRIYTIRTDGEERTVYLAGKGMPVGASKTVFGNEPSNEVIVALEDSLLVYADSKAFKEVCEQRPRLYKMYATILEKSMLEAIERLEFHSVMLPDQRYEYLMQHRPEILEKVPLKYIASYIGITPVSLSRLRARLVGKG